MGILRVPAILEAIAVKVLTSFVLEGGGGPLNVGEAAKELNIAKNNGGKIIQAVIFIESTMAWIIEKYFLGSLENNPKGAEFMEHIMNTDWCPLSAKLKLLTHVVSKTPSFPG